MKTFRQPSSNPRRVQRAMTLPEVMVTSAIFTMAMAGFLAVHIFALRYDQTVKLKLQACNDARNVLDRVAADIRSAGVVRVGNGDDAHFTEAPFGQLQAGNALEIFPDKQDTNNFIRYYCDPDDEYLKRYRSGAAEIVLARSVTNAVVFTSENDQGEVLTNSLNNRVIGVTLHFYQNQSGRGSGGHGFLYNYYLISPRVTRRALE
jgi:prepilin-type N-terminal cleavage/methylation domain-containing protein